MANRLSLVLILILVCPTGDALAQPPDTSPSPTSPPARKKGNPVSTIRIRTEMDTDYVTILDGRFRRKVLVIDYPWKTFQNASIEVRLVTDEKPDTTQIKPFMFFSDFFKAEVKINVFQCRDRALSFGARKKMEKHGIDFEIIGHRNSLGRPAVCIAKKFTHDEGPVGSIAAFCLLESWSMNRRLLNLDLPVEYFSKKGKLYIWFLRGDRILWQEIEDWPGMGVDLGEEKEYEVVQKGLPGKEDVPAGGAAAGAGESDPFGDPATKGDPFGDAPAGGGGAPAGGGAAPAKKDPFGGAF